jgi:hypothetical protein
MYKVIDIDPFWNETDELSVKMIDLESFEKNASALGHHIPEEVVTFVKGLDPDPKYIYAHVIAVSVDEYYGSNRNGDTFREKDVLGIQDEVEAAKNPFPYINAKLPRYKTFLSAHLYKHHVNKNPKNSFGTVVCAAYNNIMHRIELVIKVDRRKEQEFAEKLEKGEPIPLSMGCKVPFDICSICGNRAKNRAEYCVHAKAVDKGGMMNRIFPDGRQAKVFNTKPRFFDLSKVLIPADEQAFTLKKVASAIMETEFSPYEYFEEDDYEMEKLMTAFKSSEITKKVPGTAIGDAVKNVNTKIMGDLSKGEPDIKDNDLERAADHPLRNVLSTLTNMGMVLKPSEHRKIIIIKIQKSPDFLKESASLDVDFQDPTIYNIFKKYAADRSCYTDYLIKRAAALSNQKVAEIPEVVTDVISDCLYDSYRREVNKLDAEKIAGNIDRNFNIEGFFEKTAKVPWTVPAAAVPLGASYLYGAHQQYKRRFEGKKLGPFEKAVSEKPGKAGLLAALGAIGTGLAAKKFKIVKR